MTHPLPLDTPHGWRQYQSLHAEISSDVDWLSLLTVVVASMAAAWWLIGGMP